MSARKFWINAGTIPRLAEAIQAGNVLYCPEIKITNISVGRVQIELSREQVRRLEKVAPVLSIEAMFGQR